MAKVLKYRRRLPGPWDSSRPKKRRVGIKALLLPALVLGGAGGYYLFDVLLPPLGGGGATLSVSVSSGGQIVGRVSVIDGDTIEIQGTRIRFHGIDAPESDQPCAIEGRKVRCGQQAAVALDGKIGGNAVSCEPKDRDRYGRVVAVCHAQGVDLSGWMVANGWALAYRQYSSAYVPEEEAAAAAKVGIWQGEFTDPWEWRREDRQEAARPQSLRRCYIKGNISQSGERIYHVPGGDFYDRTKITESKGERWFCNEAEARAAGWRRSRR